MRGWPGEEQHQGEAEGRGLTREGSLAARHLALNGGDPAAGAVGAASCLGTNTWRLAGSASGDPAQGRDSQRRPVCMGVGASGQRPLPEGTEPWRLTVLVLGILKCHKNSVPLYRELQNGYVTWKRFWNFPDQI